MYGDKHYQRIIIFLFFTIVTAGILAGCGGGDPEDNMPEEEAKLLYQYEEIQDQCIRIRAYKGAEKEVRVPAHIEGKKVTEIGTGTFKNSGVEKITIPATVETIESWAFYNLSACKEIAIGNKMSLKTNDIFLKCPKLKKVDTKGEGTIVWFIGNSLIAEGNLDMYFQDICDQRGEKVIHYTNTGDGYTLMDHVNDFQTDAPETAYYTADIILIQPLRIYEDDLLRELRSHCRKEAKVYALGTMYARYQDYRSNQENWSVPLYGFTPGGDVCDDLIQKKILDFSDVQSQDEVHPTYLNGFISGACIYKELFQGDVRKIDYTKMSYALDAFIPGDTEEQKKQKIVNILEEIQKFDRDEYVDSGRASYSYSTEIKRG